MSRLAQEERKRDSVKSLSSLGSGARQGSAAAALTAAAHREKRGGETPACPKRRAGRDGRTPRGR